MAMFSFVWLNPARIAVSRSVRRFRLISFQTRGNDRLNTTPESGVIKVVLQPSRRKRSVLFERCQRERRGVVMLVVWCNRKQRVVVNEDDGRVRFVSERDPVRPVGERRALV